MLSLFKRKSDRGDEASALVEELANESGRTYPYRINENPVFVNIKKTSPSVRRDVVFAMVKWLNVHHSKQYQTAEWKIRDALLDLLKQKLPFTEEDLVLLINWSVNQRINFFRGVPQMIKACEYFLNKNPLSDALHRSIDNLIAVVSNEQQDVQARRWVMRLQELTGDTEIKNPLVGDDAWADAALKEINALPVDKRTAWAELLLQCLRVSGSSPSARWMKAADSYLDIIGREAFFSALMRWFPLADQPRPNQRNRFDNVHTLLPVNADLLKGLVWLSSKSDNPEMARSLSKLALSAYRKIAHSGPRAVKVGNACFWALANLQGNGGISQLSILKTRIKGNAVQNSIGKTLESAAKRTGMSTVEIEEISVPTYGLEDVGLLKYNFDEVECEIRVDGVEVQRQWKKSGKKITSAPKSIKEQHPEVLKSITQTVKDLRKMLPAQRNRIEEMYLSQKNWRFPDWRERYLDHPLVGTIARRLIWKFTKGDRAASGIWLNGELVGRDDIRLDWLDGETGVELWHPLHVETQVVLDWRDWLMRHEVRQPFKQAHREIYVLTDAELNTHTYSNRYAAHILRQHQFNALCAARGWKNALRLMVDDELPPAMKILPAYGLRAEFWVEGIGMEYGIDTNETGTFLYLTTDQVRFYRIDAIENRAHAAGGGYHTPRWNGAGNAEPLPLEQIPPLVFSEVFRDVDLFVGVASVGNDPSWMDGGGDARYLDYWHSYSFGALGETAKTRKQLLEILLPRLKIADRCRLTDKFLVVRGDLRTYKIHLGSSNILMEQNDQYLCIVPSRGMGGGTEKIFLPFEGDQTLAVILSKAFLLADDRKITDPTITRQIKRFS